MTYHRKTWPAATFYTMQNHTYVNNMSSEALIKLQAAIVIAVIVGATVVGVSVWWLAKPKPQHKTLHHPIRDTKSHQRKPSR